MTDQGTVSPDGPGFQNGAMQAWGCCIQDLMAGWGSVVSGMPTVSVEHAQAHLVELLDEAVQGEAVAIAVGDDMLVRWTVERKVPSPEVAATGWPMMGIYQGKGWMAPDFNEIPEGFEEYVK